MKTTQKKEVAMFSKEQRDGGLTEDFPHLTDRKLENFGIFIQTRIKTKQKTSLIEQISPFPTQWEKSEGGSSFYPNQKLPIIGRENF